MKHYVEPKSGDLVDVDTGAVVGSHNGIHNFTLGQRLRLRGMPDKVGILNLWIRYESETS